MSDSGKDFLGIAKISQLNTELKQAEQLKKLNPLGQKAIKDAPDQVDKSARQFEALLLQRMMQSMWQTVPSNGLLSGSREEELYRDMLNEAIATSVSQGKGVGIHDVVAREMAKREKSD